MKQIEELIQMRDFFAYQAFLADQRGQHVAAMVYLDISHNCDCQILQSKIADLYE